MLNPGNNPLKLTSCDFIVYKIESAAVGIGLPLRAEFILKATLYFLLSS